MTINTGRILVVDDDESIRSMLENYLAALGYDITTADDGQDAMKKFIPGKFDCVISDLMMPNIGGLDLLKAIKAIDPKISFIMITAFPSIDNAINAIKEGAYDYITKPCNMKDIRYKVERALSARRAQQSLKSMTGLLWGVIISIPVWLIFGIVLGMVWK